MILHCTDLTVRFGATTALDSADLDVAGGEVVSVMGPSGSGKSTLLRVIAGLHEPDRGTVSWDGEPLDRVPPHRRGFGLMFQDYALFPHRSVAGNVGFGLEMEGAGDPERRDRVAEMLHIVGLDGYADRQIEGLSGGEQQRVALARTLAPSPRMVMLDEPVASLDRQLRERLVVDMRRILTELGVTALYVTHDREEAFEIADRVAVMRQGGVVRVDTPERLWNDPQTRFLASFLGHDNLLESARTNRGTAIAGIPVALDLPPGPVAVATEAVRITDAEGGSATGEVISSVYRGAAFRTEISLGDGVVLVATTRRRTGAGTRVGVDIDIRGVMPLIG